MKACALGKAGGQCGGVVPQPPGSMVTITSSAGSYRMDVTEVTRAQYLMFVLAVGDKPIGTLPECAENISYGESGWGTWPPLDMPDHPMNAVDWCDAHDYCTWAGKRLCGKIGGGNNPPEASGSPLMSEWFNACSTGGTFNYPYGGNPASGPTDGYSPGTCVGEKTEIPSGTEPVGSHPDCVAAVAGASGIYDLSGNVQEWENSCGDAPPFENQCLLRGGAYNSQSNTLTCLETQGVPRLHADMLVGFRCCADP